MVVGIYQALYHDSSHAIGEDDNYKLTEAYLQNIVPPTQALVQRTAPPLPLWDLSKSTKWDAFGVAKHHH